MAVCLRADRGGGPGFFGFFSGVAGFINFFDCTPISNFEIQIISVLNFCSCKHRYLQSMFLPVFISALVTHLLQSVFLPVLMFALATQVLQSEFRPVLLSALAT
jgi:hypothetical protein